MTMREERDDFELPEGKDEALIASVIVKTIEEWTKDKAYGGGCRAFYTAEEWRARGEKYGRDAALIVCHDGGDAAPFFNLDYGSYKAFDAMEKALEKVGYYAEGCTCWYTAIYPKGGE